MVSAKVVAKAQSKARFGYVTLATREQAHKCILELNGTELKGSTIHVELVSLVLVLFLIEVYSLGSGHGIIGCC